MERNTAWFRHFRSRIPEPESIEALVQNEQEVRQIAELTAGLTLVISPKRAEKVFGKYFPVFWQTYAVYDVWGMEDATERYKRQGKRVVTVRHLPDLYRDGLEAILQYLKGKDEPDALRAQVYFLNPSWTYLYSHAKKFGDKKFLVKVKTAMEKHAGEVLAEDGWEFEKRLKEDRWFENFEKRYKGTKQKKTTHKTNDNWELEHTAMSLYRAGWNSNPHHWIAHMQYFGDGNAQRKAHGVQGSPAALRAAYLAIFDSTFCRFEEDDQKPMEIALGMLTGKRRKNLRRFTDMTYKAIIGTVDWEWPIRGLQGYLERVE